MEQVMQLLRGKRPAVAPPIQARAVPCSSPETERRDIPDAVRHALDLMKRGQFHAVPEGQDPLTERLHDLAQSLHRRMQEEVQRVVAMSVSSSNAHIGMSEMIGHVRDIDNRTQQVATAADEMLATVQDIARNSDGVAAEAEETRVAVDDATAGGREAVAAMERIAVAMEDAVRKVEALGEASGRIGAIVGQIEAIASQTNLLALNATIEAARAGSAGKGFAVVAIEVKELATQTARATEDIRGRIDGLRGDMDAIAASMHDGADAVQHGRAVIARSGDGIGRVAGLVGRVSEQMQDVAAILQQQQEASGEVVAGIAQIATLSQANMETIEAVLDLMDEPDVVARKLIDDLVETDHDHFVVCAAKADHMLWRKNLAEMVAGRDLLDPAELSDHHSCRLGRWYYQEAGEEVRALSAFRALEGPHAEVHAKGIEAARLYKGGDIAGAIRLIGETAEASARVQTLLDDLWRQTEG